jgi:DnaD/phage-associated family protein
MSGYRQIHTRIWSDSWFTELEPDLKVLFIYLFSNERASVCGLYELPVRTISFETGLDREVVRKGFEVFNHADKVKYDFETGVVWVKNMLKYQGSSSPKVQARIQADIKAVPECALKRQFLDTLSIPCARGSATSISISSMVQSPSPSLEEQRPIPAENRLTGAQPEPANVFRLYEQNMGALTPMIADSLRDAEASDGAEWVCAAIQEAVKNNRRAWSYCEAILKRWRIEGFRTDTRAVNTGRRARADRDLTPEKLLTWVDGRQPKEAG